MAAKFLLAVLVAFAAVASLGMADDVLLSGKTLYAGQSLNWGGYYLTMQSDCNLVLYDNGRPIWASGTDGRGSGCRLTMQNDGNLVVYGNNNNAVWASGTARANGNYVLVLQQDGNVVMYGSDLWSTRTNRYTVGGGITVAKDSTEPEHEDIKMVINN